MMQRLTSLPIHSVAHSIAVSGIDAFPESGSRNYGFLLGMNERCEVFMNQDMNNLCQYTGRVSLCTAGHRLVRPLKSGVSSFTPTETGRIEGGSERLF